MTQEIVETNFKPKGYQQLGVATATGLTVPAGAIFAYLSAETGPIRWRDDGTSPTGTSGNLIAVADTPFLYRGDLNTIEFIDDGATTGKINVSFLGLLGQ